MKLIQTSLTAALLLAGATTLSLAQSNPPSPGTTEQPAAAPHTSNSGTAPTGMGSTGWTGGNRGQTDAPAGGATADKDAKAAADQPEMASGKDLKGPPQHFPPNKTPE